MSSNAASLQRLALVEQALRANPANIEAWHERGGLLFALGRLEDALQSYDRVVAMRPDLPQPHDNRGLVLQHMGRYGDAIDAHTASIGRDPSFGIAHVRRALALREFGRFDQALADAERGCSLMPGAPIALNTMAMALNDVGRLDEAIAVYERAIGVQPNFVEAINNLGNALHDLGHYEAAISQFDRALELRPDYPEALCNRGLSRQELGLLSGAMQDLDAALRARPGFAEARKRRGALKLLQGDFNGGWEDYDACVDALGRRDVANGSAYGIPLWRGESLAGKSILLTEPNGFGDVIQYWRFVPELIRMGADVAFQGNPALFALLGSSAWQIRLIPDGGPVGGFDYRSQLWSIPRVLRFDPLGQECQHAYLHHDPSRVGRWSSCVEGGQFNVGICWQGRPDRKIDAGRSIPLRAFEPLSTMPGVRLISLQLGDGLDQLKQLPSGMSVISPGDGFDQSGGAYLDTAALMSQLDLVVSSDTSVAHLAGALGRPVWLGLRWMPEWRWMLDRSDTHWYPSMRLFRQPKPKDWERVMEDVRVAMAPVVARKLRAAG